VNTRLHRTLPLLLAPFLQACACPTQLPQGHPGAVVAPDEKEAILETIDRFFEAMHAHDRAALEGLLTPGYASHFQSIADGRWGLSSRSRAQDLEAIAGSSDDLAETFWQPTVLVRPPIAVVWTPYEFRRNGSVTHCGVDIFTMVQSDGRWLISSATWTREPGACDELAPANAADIRPASLR
jgi:hypothetical protein